MSPSKTETIVSEVSQFLDEGQTDQAISRLDLALQEDPTNARLLYMKGCAHADCGQLEDAIAAYEASAKHAGEKAVNPLYNLANLYKGIDDFPNAVATFNKVLQLDPSLCDAWINLGCILDDHKHHATALECYDTALRIDDQDPMTWANRGNSLRALDRLDEAEKSYRKSLELDEDNMASAVGLGGCMVERGDVEGLVLLDQAYESTRHPTVLFELATAFAKLERYADALQSYDQLIDEGMENASLWNNRGECLAKMNRADEALLSFDRAIAEDADFEAAYFGKARVLHNLDRYEEAKPIVAQLLAVASEAFKASPGIRALVTLSMANGDV